MENIMKLSLMAEDYPKVALRSDNIFNITNQHQISQMRLLTGIHSNYTSLKINMIKRQCIKHVDVQIFEIDGTEQFFIEI